jgi:hypothetical protein
MEDKRKEEYLLKFEAEKLKLKAEREARIKEYWGNLPMFERADQVPPIPRVDEIEYKEFYVPKLIAAGAIPKKDLVDGQYYYGDYRNAEVGKWNAEENVFEHWRYKFGYMKDTCNHFEDDDGFALFTPIRIANKVEIEEYLNTK